MSRFKIMMVIMLAIAFINIVLVWFYITSDNFHTRIANRTQDIVEQQVEQKRIEIIQTLQQEIYDLPKSADGADGVDGVSIRGPKGDPGQSIQGPKGDSIKGEQGIPGVDGVDGKTPEFVTIENLLFWRYVGETDLTLIGPI